MSWYKGILHASVHRFFCDNNDCEAKTFTERIPAFIQHYARRTSRLAIRQQSVAIETGGTTGQRVLTMLDMPINSDTLIRFICNAPEPDAATPRVVGIDEWAKCKGQSYGTILVDLEAHRPVDLLPDKSAESLAKWLQVHPGVEVISRDRGLEYIKGATEGATDAIQVADRWHLLKNIRDTLNELLETKRKYLKAAANVDSQEKPEQDAPSVDKEQPDASKSITRKEKDSLARRAKRLKRYKAVMELHQRGLYISKSHAGWRLCRKTVSKYIENVNRHL